MWCTKGHEVRSLFLTVPGVSTLPATVTSKGELTVSWAFAWLLFWSSELSNGGKKRKHWTKKMQLSFAEGVWTRCFSLCFVPHRSTWLEHVHARFRGSQITRKLGGDDFRCQVVPNPKIDYGNIMWEKRGARQGRTLMKRENGAAWGLTHDRVRGLKSIPPHQCAPVVALPATCCACLLCVRFMSLKWSSFESTRTGEEPSDENSNAKRTWSAPKFVEKVLSLPTVSSSMSCISFALHVCNHDWLTSAMMRKTSWEVNIKKEISINFTCYTCKADFHCTSNMNQEGLSTNGFYAAISNSFF